MTRRCWWPAAAPWAAGTTLNMLGTAPASRAGGGYCTPSGLWLRARSRARGSRGSSRWGRRTARCTCLTALTARWAARAALVEGLPEGAVQCASVNRCAVLASCPGRRPAVVGPPLRATHAPSRQVVSSVRVGDGASGSGPAAAPSPVCDAQFDPASGAYVLALTRGGGMALFAAKEEQEAFALEEVAAMAKQPAADRRAAFVPGGAGSFVVVSSKSSKRRGQREARLLRVVAWHTTTPPSAARICGPAVQQSSCSAGLRPASQDASATVRAQPIKTRQSMTRNHAPGRRCPGLERLPADPASDDQAWRAAGARAGRGPPAGRGLARARGARGRRGGGRRRGAARGAVAAARGTHRDHFRGGLCPSRPGRLGDSLFWCDAWCKCVLSSARALQWAHPVPSSRAAPFWTAAPLTAACQFQSGHQ